jgi:hypothetical protein
MIVKMQRKTFNDVTVTIQPYFVNTKIFNGQVVKIGSQTKDLLKLESIMFIIDRNSILMVFKKIC